MSFMKRNNWKGIVLAGCVTLAVVIFSLVPAWADKLLNQIRPPAGEAALMRLSAPQAVRVAITNNLRMTSMALSLQQAQHEKNASYSDLFPQLSVEYLANVNRYQQPGNVASLAGIHASRWLIRGNPNDSTNQITNTYPYRIDPFKNFQLTATLTQPLYAGGLLVNSYKNSILAVHGSEQDFETAKEDLALSVLKAYYQAVLGIKLLLVAEESIRDLEAFKRRARAMYKAGEALKIDITAAEAHLSRARVQRTKALTDLKTARSSLNLLLGFPQNTPIDLEDNLRYQSADYRIPEIYNIAVMNRPEIRRANISTEQAKAQVKVAEAALMPSINLQVQGQRINDDWNVIDPEGTNQWSLQGLFTWSFDFFRNRETVTKKRAAQAQSNVDKQYLIEQVIQQVHAAYLQVEHSKLDIPEVKKEVAFRQQQFALVKKMYNEQLATYLNVVDAQTGLDRAKASHFGTLTDHLVNVAVLERQMGILR